uniref:Uncharacterized protein n=1 Tax=Arundo donax TaxID=35708 RepID=A0A0A9AMC8_ARUDO
MTSSFTVNLIRTILLLFQPCSI